MRSYRRTLSLIFVSILADFIFRLLIKNDQNFVLIFEFFLFLAISFLFFYFRKKSPIVIRKIDRLEFVLAYFYFFGALRVLLILSGIEIYYANIVLLFASAIAVIYHLFIKKVSL